MECKQFSFCMCYAQTENRAREICANKEGKQRGKSTICYPANFYIACCCVYHCNVRTFCCHFDLTLCNDTDGCSSLSVSLCVCVRCMRCICVCVYILSDVMLYDKLIWPSSTNFRVYANAHNFSAISFIRLFVFFRHRNRCRRWDATDR